MTFLLRRYRSPRNSRTLLARLESCPLSHWFSHPTFSNSFADVFGASYLAFFRGFRLCALLFLAFFLLQTQKLGCSRCSRNNFMHAKSLQTNIVSRIFRITNIHYDVTSHPCFWHSSPNAWRSPSSLSSYAIPFQ